MRGTEAAEAEPADSPWSRRALALLDEEERTAAPTPLRACPLPPECGVRLYFKDESVRPSGSGKHGFVKSLLRDAIRSGRVKEGMELIDASSGNAAVSEAWFARLLGLPFTAMIPQRTDPAKAARIERLGGTCVRVDPPLAVYERARRRADDGGGCYLDFLGRIGDALDWSSEAGLGAEIVRGLGQLGELAAALAWLVAGVGSGATSTALGRFLRDRSLPTKLAVADPENSAYFPGWASGVDDYSTGMPTRIEGIGRPRMEPAFVPDLVDLVIPVPDALSVAAMRLLHQHAGIHAGPSTGAVFYAACRLAAARRARHGGGGDARCRHGVYGHVLRRRLDQRPRLGRARRDRPVDEVPRHRGVDRRPGHAVNTSWRTTTTSARFSRPPENGRGVGSSLPGSSCSH